MKRATKTLEPCCILDGAYPRNTNERIHAILDFVYEYGEKEDKQRAINLAEESDATADYDALDDIELDALDLLSSVASEYGLTVFCEIGNICLVEEEEDNA